jgi:hypothetical protein
MASVAWSLATPLVTSDLRSKDLIAVYISTRVFIALFPKTLEQAYFVFVPLNIRVALLNLIEFGIK